ncbi:6-phospho-beta-glucosidase [Pantoea rodasii]|uniref:6-phospho-beta-glucosidase n=1 Tax=Pantoea rodasii TaxID=1076549 RepID=A0A2M9WFL0_9GAMM|nr:6-phospho-beta-glucosidase [Pantoea rodasii]ORM57545.1 6-phospho-beta-glucosidase [Pantoea rodasii]PJZ06248.1 6-phospho-beta-glucosidase [Pantoea rodasii]
MPNKIKIVTIGGGSSYTPELIEGLILRKDQLPIAELWLVDIEDGAEKMEIVGSMARRMIAAAKLDWQVHLSLDRKEALKDADYVTTQFRVGLLDARLKDEVIPLANGMLGQETNGAGGIFKAFRTVPVILAIIEDMRELCPNAWLVDFTNPAGMVTEAAINYGKWEKTVGLCNVPFGHITQACSVLAANENDLYFKFAGLNHFHWHRVWDRQGNERTAELIEKIYSPDQQEKSDEGLKNIHQIPFNFDQVKHLGLLPCGYHRYYYLQEPMLAHAIEEFDNYETRAEVVKKTEARLFELYKDVNLNYKPEELSQRGGAHYSDAACDLIASIQNNSGKLMVVSTRNHGAIADLPFDCVVEVTAAITSHGAEPLRWGALPPAARGMIQLMKAMEETVIEAAVSGDYGAALHAFTINPLIPAGDTAIKVLDQLLYAHKAYLPNFAHKIVEIERNQPEVVAFVDRLLADRAAHA